MIDRSMISSNLAGKLLVLCLVLDCFLISDIGLASVFIFLAFSPYRLSDWSSDMLATLTMPSWFCSTDCSGSTSIKTGRMKLFSSVDFGVSTFLRFLID